MILFKQNIVYSYLMNESADVSSSLNLMAPVNESDTQIEEFIKSVVWIMGILVEKIVTYYWESLS